MENLPGFDRSRYEGALEYPITAQIFLLVGFAFFLIGLILASRAAFLTIAQGDTYAMRSEDNRLRHSVIIPERGIIKDRNGEPLAFNVPGFRVIITIQTINPSTLTSLLAEVAPIIERDIQELTSFVEAHSFEEEIVIGTLRDWSIATQLMTQWKNYTGIRIEPTPLRAYTTHPAFSHVVGYISTVTKEDIEQNENAMAWGGSGRSGIELAFNETLRGYLGLKILETDSKGSIISDGVYQKEERGKDITLSISADMQRVLYDAIGHIVEERGFTSGSGAALDARTGEILSIVSYPSFDLNILNRGYPRDAISVLFTDERKPLFFRTLAGLYPPASTVKPFLAAAALEEQIIQAEKIIYTDGRLVVPNPYNPEHPAIFHDWKNHGPVAMRDAIAVSSDVYFYTIGGGYGNQKGLGQERIASYLKSFGIGQSTGISIPGEKSGNMPDSAWKAQRYPEDPVWRIGDTYNISIGQGGMTTTPLQMARATLALANGGILKNIRIVRNISTASEDEKLLPLTSESITVAREGMRRAVIQGTAIGVSDIPLPVAAKTGTAEVGKTGRVHSWFIGFLPWENPELVLVINLEDGSATNLVGATAAAHEVLRWYTNGGKESVWRNSQDL